MFIVIMLIIACLVGLLFIVGCKIDSPRTNFKNCLMEEMLKNIEECENPRIKMEDLMWGNYYYYLDCQYYNEKSLYVVTGEINKLCNRKIYGEP